MSVRLLIVDDEEEIRTMLSRHFRFKGYEVGMAENGQDALRKLEEEKFDIIVSDVKMPVMDGVELLRTTREQYPMIQTIMMTGYVTLGNALSCLKYGAETCIFKPIQDLSTLDAAVSTAVNTIRRWVTILEELRAMRPSEEREGT